MPRVKSEFQPVEVIESDVARIGSTSGAGLRAVTRTIAVLTAFRRTKPIMSLTDLAESCHLDLATTLRYARTLCDAGLLERHPDGRYTLGFVIVDLAQTCISQLGIRDYALPTMKRMRDELNETVLLSVRSGPFRVCVEEVEGYKEYRRSGGIGQHVPLYLGCPSKALLAYLPEAEIDAYLDSLPSVGADGRPVDVQAIRRDLERCRRDGRLETVNERGIGGAGVAAPVRDHNGDVVAAINIASLVTTWPEIRERAHELVLEGAREISEAMGYRP